MSRRCEQDIKVTVVGEKGVGKTALVERYVRGTFLEEYKPTIGAMFLTKTVFCGAKLQVWGLLTNVFACRHDSRGRTQTRALGTAQIRLGTSGTARSSRCT